MPSPEKFKKSLEQFGIDHEISAQIDQGYEDICDRSPKKTRAAYFKRAVDIMAENVDAETLQAVFEWNACCKGGAREKASKAFAKENVRLSIDERLQKIKDVPYMGQPVRNEDGTITVHAVYCSNGKRFFCACTNFNDPKCDLAVSKQYCFCCAGHFRHHYEIMLGVKLKTVEIVSSPLDSGGKYPCVIRYAID